MIRTPGWPPYVWSRPTRFTARRSNDPGVTLAFLETAQKTGYYYWAEAVGHEKLDETMANAYHAGHLPAQPQWVNSRIGA